MKIALVIEDDNGHPSRWADVIIEPADRTSLALLVRKLDNLVRTIAVVVVPGTRDDMT